MAEKQEHTPGPWKIHTLDEFMGETPLHADFMIEFGPGDWGGFWVVEHNGASKECTRTSPMADAALIAAAPDLLAALQGLFENCAMVHNHWGDNSNQRQASAAIDAARAVIASARGE